MPERSPQLRCIERDLSSQMNNVTRKWGWNDCTERARSYIWIKLYQIPYSLGKTPLDLSWLQHCLNVKKTSTTSPKARGSCKSPVLIAPDCHGVIGQAWCPTFLERSRQRSRAFLLFSRIHPPDTHPRCHCRRIVGRWGPPGSACCASLTGGGRSSPSYREVPPSSFCSEPGYRRCWPGAGHRGQSW